MIVLNSVILRMEPEKSEKTLLDAVFSPEGSTA